MTFRVHVVFTGGTIGATVSGNTTDLVESTDRQLLSSATLGTDLRFTTSEPLRILSEDATLEDWSCLASHIAGLDLDRVDALIVAHGSDTLAWTAKALAYSLGGIPIPLILIGSDKPLSDPGSNGADNFRDALSFAASERLPGVFVAWKNPGESTTIHLATRILPCDIYDDRFRSARGLDFGCVVDGGFRRNAVEGNPSRSHLAKAAQMSTWKPTGSEARRSIGFSPDVLVLPAMPGAVGPWLFGDHPWKAVLQLAYHSGTASSLDGTDTLFHLAGICRERGIPLFVGPTRSTNTPYASAIRLRGQGVRFAPSMTESALVVKLRWLAGTGQDLSSLLHPIAFDILGP